MTELSDDQQLYLNLRDVRVLALDRAMIIEQELRESPTLNAIIDAIGADSEAAMHEFAVVNPLDRLAVSALQARVFCLTYLRQTINEIRLRGDQASASLSEESHYQSDTSYE
jgi:hypothetical protein